MRAVDEVCREAYDRAAGSVCHINIGPTRLSGPVWASGIALSDIENSSFLERYRSGHNGTDSKSVGGITSHVGSNPTLSAISHL